MLQGLGERIGARLKEAQMLGHLTMTDAAAEAWGQNYRVLSGERPGLLGAILGRAEAQALRIALIYALLDNKSQIDLPHLGAGLAVVAFCEDSTAQIWGDMIGDSVADTILVALKTAGSAGMPRTHLGALFSRHESSARISNVLSSLERAGQGPADARGRSRGAAMVPHRGNPMSAHRYLDTLNRVAEAHAHAQTAQTAQTGVPRCQIAQNAQNAHAQRPIISVLAVLETRCPEHVPVTRWQQCIDDGRAFLATWGEQAERLGWIARDLFGLFPVPENPHPTFSRLSRYDHTGLIWLLDGCPVIALTEATAAIQTPSGAITIYRKHNKPALGPTGDSLDCLNHSDCDR